MSEADWLSRPTLYQLTMHGPAALSQSVRKLRLYSIACCRWAGEWLEDPDLPVVIEVAERMADYGRPTQWPACVTRLARRLADPLFVSDVRQDDFRSLAEAVSDLFLDSPPASQIQTFCYQAVYGYPGSTDPALAELLHDIFGNPFRPVAFDPIWRTSTVEAIAAGCYADRAFDRLPTWPTPWKTPAATPPTCSPTSATPARMYGAAGRSTSCWAKADGTLVGGGEA